MGVYSIKNNTVFDESAIDAIECKFEPGIEAAVNIVAESEENYNKIMQAIGVHELAVFESTGSEMIYEGADISALMKKVKEFFMNILKKIKGLIDKFIAMVDSFVKSDADFVKKYSSKIITVNSKDLKVKGFEFDHMDYSLPSQDTMEGIFKNEADTSEKETILNKMRGKVFGESKEVESGEFTKELFRYFRKGEDSKVDLEKIDPRTQLNIIKGTKDLKTKATKKYKELSDSINKAIKNLEKDAKEATNTAVSKDSDDATANAATNSVRKLNTQIDYSKDAISILQVANGAYLTAIKDQNRQAKSICVKLLGYEPKHESYSFDEGAVEESFLSGVVLK